MLTNRVLNPRCQVAAISNGVEVEAFAFSEQGNGRAVCVGGISRRKRQWEASEALGTGGITLDLVGPIDHEDEETREVARRVGYLGEWTREEIYARLTDYSVLVLFSRAEAQPLVAMEAMAAGLDVVLSPESARNVDVSLPWVHIAGRAEELPYRVAAALAGNPDRRAEIRAYAERELGWEIRGASIEAQLSEWMASSRTR